MNSEDMHNLDEKNKAKIYANLKKLIESPIFSTSPRQQRFIKYLIDKTLNGSADTLKGYTIGVEVYDRGVDFDSTLDSIVRVEAGRLRAKLREYYEKLGKDDPIRFEFPKGTYGIEINFRKFDDKIILMRHDDAPINKIVHRNLPTKNPLQITKHPTIAILPFINISADSSNRYISDGIADTLFLEIQNLPGLFLISRQSSFTFRDRSKQIDEIGLELGARYLLDGSVQRIGNRMRVSVHLSDSLTGQCVWTERYDSNLEELFELQDKITINVLKMLHLRVIGPIKNIIGHEGTTSLAAYDLLMCGLKEYWKYTLTSLNEAMTFFKLALRQDPDYASAHAWLARAITFKWIMCWQGNDANLDNAYEHAKTAIKLNKYLPCAFSILGWVLLWKKSFQEAITSCRKAVFLDPSNADSVMFLSACLSASGQSESALHYIEMGMQLSQNPSSFHLFVLGQAHYTLKNYDQAELAWQKGCEVNDQFMLNHYYLCLQYIQQNREEDSYRKRNDIHAKNNGEIIHIRAPWADSEAVSRHQELVLKAGFEFK